MQLHWSQWYCTHLHCKTTWVTLWSNPGSLRWASLWVLHFRGSCSSRTLDQTFSIWPMHVSYISSRLTLRLCWAVWMNLCQFLAHSNFLQRTVQNSREGVQVVEHTQGHLKKPQFCTGWVTSSCSSSSVPMGTILGRHLEKGASELSLKLKTGPCYQVLHLNWRHGSRHSV